MVLTKLDQHINGMMAVTVKQILNFLSSRFLIIRQIFNMATNAILYCSLPFQRVQLFRDRDGSTSLPLTNPMRALLA